MFSASNNGRPTKKPRLEPRLEIRSDMQDFAVLKLRDVESISNQVGAPAYRFLETSAMFQHLRFGWTGLQLRFFDLRKHREAEFGSWLNQHANSATKSKWRMTTSRQGSFLRTFSDVREDAHAAGNSDVAERAAIYEASVAASLVSAPRPIEEILAIVPDLRNRFDDVLKYLETLRQANISDEVNAQTSVPDEQETARQEVGREEPLTTAQEPSQNTVNRETRMVTTSHPSAGSMGALSDPQSDWYLIQRLDHFRVTLEDVNTIPWGSVRGQDDLKRKLDASVALLPVQANLKRKPSSPPGILLFGPQGTGKTCLVKSFAKDHSLPLFAVGSNIKQTLQGDSEKLLQLLFAEIRRTQPCVLLLDEVDGLFRDPGHDVALAGILGTIKCLWTDLIESEANVFVFGATKNPWVIPDDGFTRRFQEMIYMGLPDVQTRRKLFEISFVDDHTLTENQIQQLADMTEGYTGSDIRGAVGRAYRALDKTLAETQAWKEFNTSEGKRYFPARLEPGECPVSIGELDLSGGALIRQLPLRFEHLECWFAPESDKRLRKTVDPKAVERYEKFCTSR